MSKDENEDLRIRSGSIDTDEKLVSFLYSLMREYKVADLNYLGR